MIVDRQMNKSHPIHRKGDLKGLQPYGAHSRPKANVVKVLTVKDDIKF